MQVKVAVYMFGKTYITTLERLQTLISRRTIQFLKAKVQGRVFLFY